MQTYAIPTTYTEGKLYKEMNHIDTHTHTYTHAHTHERTHARKHTSTFVRSLHIAAFTYLSGTKRKLA